MFIFGQEETDMHTRKQKNILKKKKIKKMT